mgnify:CR=1 FL=1
MAKSFLDILVLAYNNFETLTRPCLESLLIDLPGCAEDVAISVLDNASPDGSGQDMLVWARKYPFVQVTASKKNLGFAGGMNSLAEQGSGEWLLLANNDTCFAKGALPRLVEVLKTCPSEVGLVGPITNAAGNAQHYDFGADSKEEILLKGAALVANPTGMLIPSYRIDFFCAAIRRRVWEKLNGLDRSFGLGYYEDFDFSLRAKQAGSKLVITEDVFVWHKGGAAFSASAGQKRLIKENKKKFLKLHPEAMLPHRRHENLRALCWYAENQIDKSVAGAYFLRSRYRQNMLISDLPRGLIKRFLWKLKISRLNLKLPQKPN